jgi:hypothetical protein
LGAIDLIVSRPAASSVKGRTLPFSATGMTGIGAFETLAPPRENAC